LENKIRNSRTEKSISLLLLAGWLDVVVAAGFYVLLLMDMFFCNFPFLCLLAEFKKAVKSVRERETNGKRFQS